MSKSLIKSVVSSFFLIILLFSCASTIKQTNPTGQKVQLRTDVVNVTGGELRGIYTQDGNIEIYASVPFAAPPVGELRWKEPQDIIPWDGILEADHFAPMAMQKKKSALYNFLFQLYTHSQKDRTFNGPQSEDCLYLNVWKPTEKAPEGGWPVLVYIHGGSLMSGQSWYEKYDGENLARNGIIFVSIAYRTGVFGYLADKELAAESEHGTTGNYGLLDQIKALEWVHNNIAAFGGNADNVTIAGESAGSSSVNALCASPLTKGYFRRAIGESSSVVQKTPPHTFRKMEAALKMGDDIKAEFNCKNIEELRAVPAEKLIKTKYANNSMCVDGYALPQTPFEIYQKGENHEEALLNGFNKQEAFGFTYFTKVNKDNLASLLEPSLKDNTDDFLSQYGEIKTKKQAREIYNEVFSAVCFTYPHECWSNTVKAQGKPVYEYYFSRENKEFGTYHSGEIIYAYKNVPHTKNYEAYDYELEEIMSSYWLNFVKTGNPNGLDTNGNPLPVWETKAESNGLLMELGDTCTMVEDPFNYIYDYLVE